MVDVIHRMCDAREERGLPRWVDPKQDDADVVPHGVARSTFKDYCTEVPDFADEVSEAALAHAPKNKVSAAYKRDTFFEKRVALMVAWEAHCMGRPAGEEVDQAAE